MVSACLPVHRRLQLRSLFSWSAALPVAEQFLTQAGRLSVASGFPWLDSGHSLASLSTESLWEGWALGTPQPSLCNLPPHCYLGFLSCSHSFSFLRFTNVVNLGQPCPWWAFHSLICWETSLVPSILATGWCSASKWMGHLDAWHCPLHLWPIPQASLVLIMSGFHSLPYGHWPSHLEQHTSWLSSKTQLDS